MPASSTVTTKSSSSVVPPQSQASLQPQPQQQQQFTASGSSYIDNSKAVLPFSLSITTLNKLLNPSPDLMQAAQMSPTISSSSFQLITPQFIQTQQQQTQHPQGLGIKPILSQSIKPQQSQQQGKELVSDDQTVGTMDGNIAPLPTMSELETKTEPTNQQYSYKGLQVDTNLSIDEDQPLEFKAHSNRSGSHNSNTMNHTPMDPNQPHPELFSMRSNSDQKSMGSVVSDNSSNKNFQSASANDEYAKLTALLKTQPSSPSEDLWGDERKDRYEDGYIFLPYIEIGVNGSSLKTSYPGNSTPAAQNVHNQNPTMPNTAKEIPHDLQEDENYTSPLIMRHVIKKPDDIYLTNIVKAYQYPKAYHALIAYLKKRFDRNQLIEIAKCMAKYRPSFISATKSLYENDLIFTERSFQRTLLEYERLINLSPSPTIIWRRTGEIVALTSEFATMTGYSKMSLLSKRTFIVELMDDESALKYFESFSEMAFGDLNATFLTDCNIRKANDEEYLKCSCVWTIKRDVFDIPMMIVGQFLPVLT